MQAKIIVINIPVGFVFCNQSFYKSADLTPKMHYKKALGGLKGKIKGLYEGKFMAAASIS